MHGITKREYKLKVKHRTKSLSDKTKRILMRCINNSPGIRYRELLRATGFSNGVMAYHLKKLEKSKQIKVRRYDRRGTRFYPFSIAAKELQVIEHIRRKTASEIVLFLSQYGPRTFKRYMTSYEKGTFNCIMASFTTQAWRNNIGQDGQESNV